MNDFNRRERVLVVLEADGAQPDQDSRVLQRARSLCERGPCDMLLFQVCYDASLSFGGFAARSDIEQARARAVERETQTITELRKRLGAPGDSSISCEVVWDEDRADAILRKARDWRADLILKLNGERNYVLGLFSNLDWDLLRHSPVPVWFVSAECERLPDAGVIAAIDQMGDDAGSEEHFALDDLVFDAAKRLSDRYGAPLYVVHAYQLPRGLSGFEGYAPIYPGGGHLMPAPAPTPGMTEAQQQARDAVARRHGEAIQSFVDEHGVPLDDLHVLEGLTAEVIGSVAREREAGLVVMGAGSKGRWERLLGRVSAEPMLADTPCDLLFVKPRG